MANTIKWAFEIGQEVTSLPMIHNEEITWPMIHNEEITCPSFEGTVFNRFINGHGYQMFVVARSTDQFLWLRKSDELESRTDHV